MQTPTISKPPRVFLDTHVVTLFTFLENPDEFIPEGESEAYFMITMPVVRELERIKDEHFSKGQRSRAKKCLDLLEAASPQDGFPMSDRSSLHFYWQEPSEGSLRYGGQSTPRSPDDHFIAAVYQSVLHYTNRPYKVFVLSDDIGVRIRTIHHLRDFAVIALKPPTLRHNQESFELPRLVQETVKALAKELAASMREAEAREESDKSED